jgi:hypothetical protein
MITAIRVQENPLPGRQGIVVMSEASLPHGAAESPEGSLTVKAQSATPEPTTNPTGTSTGAVSTPMLDPVVRDHREGLKDEIAGDESIDHRLAEFEMIGEETATGWSPGRHASLSPEVRYLHISRTIHQLVTDRNRSVRVERVNPLSIFYVMHLLVVVLGGASAGLFSAMVAYDWLDDGVLGVNVDPSTSTAGLVGPLSVGLATALVFIVGLQSLYYVTILRNTTAAKLDAAKS